VLCRKLFERRDKLLLPRGDHPVRPRLLHGGDRVRRPGARHLWVPEAYDAVRERRIPHLLPCRHCVSCGLPGAFGDNGEDLLLQWHLVRAAQHLLQPGLWHDLLFVRNEQLLHQRLLQPWTRELLLLERPSVLPELRQRERRLLWEWVLCERGDVCQRLLRALHLGAPTATVSRASVGKRPTPDDHCLQPRRPAPIPHVPAIDEHLCAGQLRLG
jgi:hypothetical protein